MLVAIQGKGFFFWAVLSDVSAVTEIQMFRTVTVNHTPASSLWQWQMAKKKIGEGTGQEENWRREHQVLCEDVARLGIRVEIESPNQTSGV